MFERLGIFAVVAIFTLFIAGVIGWGMNGYALMQCDFKSPYKAEVIRTVGFCIPVVGAVAGYVDIDDSPDN